VPLATSLACTLNASIWVKARNNEPTRWSSARAILVLAPPPYTQKLKNSRPSPTGYYRTVQHCSMYSGTMRGKGLVLCRSTISVSAADHLHFLGGFACQSLGDVGHSPILRPTLNWLDEIRWGSSDLETALFVLLLPPPPRSSSAKSTVGLGRALLMQKELMGSTWWVTNIYFMIQP
jgi:hypothetical protein